MPFTFTAIVEITLTCDVCGRTEAFAGSTRPEASAAAKRAVWSFSLQGNYSCRCPEHRGQRIPAFPDSRAMARGGGKTGKENL